MNAQQMKILHKTNITSKKKKALVFFVEKFKTYEDWKNGNFSKPFLIKDCDIPQDIREIAKQTLEEEGYIVKQGHCIQQKVESGSTYLLGFSIYLPE